MLAPARITTEKGPEMSNVIAEAVKALAEKIGPTGFDGTVKFVIKDEGAIMVDGSGVRVGDEEADVTLTASTETFQRMMAGDLNPTSAFMTGKLSLDGNMSMAMKLGSLLG